MLENLGIMAGSAILYLASVLRFPESPGLVVVLLLCIFVLICVYTLVIFSRRRFALIWFGDIIRSFENETDFGARITEIDQRIDEQGKSRERRQIANAWSEYRETLVSFETGDETVLRNSVRPGIFFNVDDLGFSSGFLRIVPGLFVTVGLFLTFLGLISALGALSGDLEKSGEITQKAMTDMLAVASAKFIMSLTGLFCSILFTIILRYSIGLVEKHLHGINAALEHRLSFISLEDLATEQLKAIREQKDHIKAIGIDLVATLADRLTKELPDAIGSKIATAVENAVKPLETLPSEVSKSMEKSLGPILEKVGQAGSEGMGDMVRDLSQRFSTDVAQALGQASERLTEAGDRIGDLVGKMDQSSGRMGGEMETAIVRLGQAVEDLRNTMTSGATETAGAFQAGTDQLLAAMSETLSGIRENTADGATAMRDAAADMRKAAEGIREELENAAKEGADAAKERLSGASYAATEAIGAAGIDISGAFGRTSAEVARLTAEIGDKAGQDLLQPLESLAKRLETMVEAVRTSTNEMRRASDGMRAGADASSDAAGRFSESAHALTEAAGPVRSTVEGLRGSTTELAESTRRIAETTRQNSESVKVAIEAAQSALEAERDGVQATLEGLRQSIERLKGQGDRLDDMDEKLGVAFERYTVEIETAVEALSGHVRGIQDQLAPALDTLREVVEQAEHFAPQSRRS